MSPTQSQVVEEDSDLEFDPLNPVTAEDEGWEDVEPEEEERFEYKSLFDEKKFSSLAEVINYDSTTHSLDLSAAIQDFALDWMGAAKLVNYVRAEAANGHQNLRISDPAVFADAKYLKPVLEDDAVLFSLGDLFNLEEADGKTHNSGDRVEELELQLLQAQTVIREMRLMSQRSFDGIENGPSDEQVEATRKETAVRENDRSYFKSYAYNDIHEIMLKDTIRTDAYRDFIYDNKDLFSGKVVLDVGCGTGILSMMCAKAGASKVFAVDNSEIINKARANVHENGLDNIVTCLHGKIEEIILPVAKVDIIVSEWMGYALLYESMLDSVIHARDRYLAPGGLMVPSHSTLFIAPTSLPDVMSDRLDFWDDVYGFRMSAMHEGAFDEALLRNLTNADLVGTPSAFLQLSLHTTKVEDTIFNARQFSSTITKDENPVDGFAIWFDMFFARRPDTQVTLQTRASEWKDGTAFSTGPGPATHWQQAVLLFDLLKRDRKPVTIAKEATIEGSVSYTRRQENERGVDIGVTWKTENHHPSSTQRWELA